MYTMTITNMKNEVKILKQSAPIDRMMRRRCVTAIKNQGIIIQSKEDRNGLAKEFGEFGNIWAKKYKNEKTALPSLDDLLQGLLQWLVRQIEAMVIQANSNIVRKNIIRNSRRNLQTIFEAVEITKEDMDKALTLSETDPILGLRNPYSKATCMVLYLYSMELGLPPLYAEANKVARDVDLRYLKELGPFIRALNSITSGTESYKMKGDKVASGNELGGVKNNICGSFLLFRGALMKQQWLVPYFENVGLEEVRIPGCNSCSKSLVVALNFAF